MTQRGRVLKIHPSGKEGKDPPIMPSTRNLRQKSTDANWSGKSREEWKKQKAWILSVLAFSC